MSLLPWQMVCFSSTVSTHRPLNPALTLQHLKPMKASNGFPLHSLKDFPLLYIMHYLLVTTFYSGTCHLLWLVTLFHKLRALPNIGSYAPSGYVSLSDIFILFSQFVLQHQRHLVEASRQKVQLDVAGVVLIGHTQVLIKMANDNN